MTKKFLVIIYFIFSISKTMDSASLVNDDPRSSFIEQNLKSWNTFFERPENQETTYYDQENNIIHQNPHYKEIEIKIDGASEKYNVGTKHEFFGFPVVKYVVNNNENNILKITFSLDIYKIYQSTVDKKYYFKHKKNLSSKTDFVNLPLKNIFQVPELNFINIIAKTDTNNIINLIGYIFSMADPEKDFFYHNNSLIYDEKYLPKKYIYIKNLNQFIKTKESAINQNYTNENVLKIFYIENCLRYLKNKNSNASRKEIEIFYTNNKTSIDTRINEARLQNRNFNSEIEDLFELDQNSLKKAEQEKLRSEKLNTIMNKIANKITDTKTHAFKMLKNAWYYNTSFIKKHFLQYLKTHNITVSEKEIETLYTENKSFIDLINKEEIKTQPLDSMMQDLFELYQNSLKKAEQERLRPEKLNALINKLKNKITDNRTHAFKMLHNKAEEKSKSQHLSSSITKNDRNTSIENQRKFIEPTITHYDKEVTDFFEDEHVALIPDEKPAIEEKYFIQKDPSRYKKLRNRPATHTPLTIKIEDHGNNIHFNDNILLHKDFKNYIPPKKSSPLLKKLALLALVSAAGYGIFKNRQATIKTFHI